MFLLATNYVSDFDAAFSRSGRFDRMLQVMPPTAAEKKKCWPVLDQKLKLLTGQQIRVGPGDEELDADEALADLTFDEAEVLAEKLSQAAEGDAVKSEFETVYRSCTLARTNRTAKSTSGGANEASAEVEHGALTWKKSCEEDRSKIRLR